MSVVSEPRETEPIAAVYTPSNEFASLRFVVPNGMEVEYVDSIQALNIYAKDGPDTSLDRSQIFIRYFDADRFLTLSTVNIYSTSDLAIGKGNYVARQYDIEKKTGVPNFAGQPSWRNARHTVTDTRKKAGRTRYYVLAKNPELDQRIFDEFLAGLEIVD